MTMGKKKIMKKNKKQVTVCITTLNCFSLFKKCIEKLIKSTSIPFDILVLDLGNDETYNWCQNQKITVFKKKLPYYFAQSNNFLASKVKTDLILFLNPDTEPQKNFIELMLKDIENKNADIVGCKLLFPDGKIQHAGITWKEYNYELPRHIGYDDFNLQHYSNSYLVEGVTAACMLIKKKIFKKLKGFDKTFKNGYEDVDLCRRATMTKLKIWYCGKATVIHHEGATMGVDGKQRTSLQFFEHNKQLLLQKYGR